MNGGNLPRGGALLHFEVRENIGSYSSLHHLICYVRKGSIGRPSMSQQSQFINIGKNR